MSSLRLCTVSLDIGLTLVPSFPTQADSTADVIRCDRESTVGSLTAKLVRICRAGGHDGGFPVVEKEAGGLRLRGIIAVNELQHALGTSIASLSDPSPLLPHIG